MRNWLFVLMLGMAGACLAPPSAPPAAGVVVRTVPEGALLTFADGTRCETPCRVDIPAPIGVTIGKAGYRAIRTEIAPSRVPVVLTMTPVGRSQRVEEAELPEL